MSEVDCHVERELIEQLIWTGWIESGPADNRVREKTYGPLVREEMGSYCFFCGAEEEWFKGPDHTHTDHKVDCAWVVAMRLLGHPLPEGHNVGEVIDA